MCVVPCSFHVLLWCFGLKAFKSTKQCVFPKSQPSEVNCHYAFCFQCCHVPCEFLIWKVFKHNNSVVSDHGRGWILRVLGTRRSRTEGGLERSTWTLAGMRIRIMLRIERPCKNSTKAIEPWLLTKNTIYFSFYKWSFDNLFFIFHVHFGRTTHCDDTMSTSSEIRTKAQERNEDPRLQLQRGLQHLRSGANPLGCLRNNLMIATCSQITVTCYFVRFGVSRDEIYSLTLTWKKKIWDKANSNLFLLLLVMSKSRRRMQLFKLGLLRCSLQMAPASFRLNWRRRTWIC